MDEKPKYNVQRHRNATVRSSIRAVAALYLAYLGYGLIRGSGEDEAMPAWAGIAVGVLFIVLAAGIGFYAWRQHKVDLKNAEVRPEDLEQLPPEDEEQPSSEDEEHE